MQHKIQFPMQKELTVKDDADKNVVEEAQAGNATVSLGAQGLLAVQCIEEHGH